MRSGRRAAAALAAGLALACGDLGAAPVASAPPQLLGEAPAFRLVDQQGLPFESAQLAGRLWVADFVFTRCRMTCPALSARMAELARELRDDPLAREVHLVSFSVDPEHDRPQLLAEYAARFHADPSRWSFLTGERAAIWELCAQGFKLPVGDAPANPDEPLFHSDRFVLVDRGGRIRGYYDALEPEGFASLLADLRALSRAPGDSS